MIACSRVMPIFGFSGLQLCCAITLSVPRPRLPRGPISGFVISVSDATIRQKMSITKPRKFSHSVNTREGFQLLRTSMFLEE